MRLINIAIDRIISDQSIIIQTLRYVGVGGIVYLVDLTVYFIGIAFVHDAYLWFNILAKIVAASVGFCLHKYFTFTGGEKHRTGRQVGQYIALLVVNASLATGLLFVGVTMLGHPEGPTKIITDIIVVCIAFLVCRAIFFGGAANK